MKSLRIQKELSETISRSIDNTMVKVKNKTKGQQNIQKTLHSILRFEKHEPIKTGVNSGAPEG